MSCVLRARSPAVLFKPDGTLVILIYHVICDGASLGFQEMAGPEHEVHCVIYSDDFGLGGAASVQLLLTGQRDWASLPHTHGCSGVTPHVGMDGKTGIDPPVDGGCVICLEGERVVPGVADKSKTTSQFLPVVFIGLPNSGA